MNGIYENSDCVHCPDNGSFTEYHITNLAEIEDGSHYGLQVSVGCLIKRNYQVHQERTQKLLELEAGMGWPPGGA